MKHAVILAAGRGSRMGELTRELPKPLIPINGRPMILHILDRMAAAGVEKVLLITGYLADQIEAVASTHSLPTSFLRQATIDGTAHAALLARAWVGDDAFLLTFGDILAEPEHYVGMAEMFPGSEGILAARHVEDPYQGAAIYIDGDNRVEKIIEKPPIGTSTTQWNSAGIYIFSPSLFAELARVPLSDRGEYELTTAITQLLEAGKTLRLFALEGTWLDVGRPADIATAERALA